MTSEGRARPTRQARPRPPRTGLGEAAARGGRGALERRVAAAKAVIELGTAVASSLHLQDIFELVVDYACRLLRVPRCGLAVVENDGSQAVLRFVARRGMSARFPERMRPLHWRDGTTPTAISERRSVWTPDLLQDPAFPLTPSTRAAVVAEGYRAVLSVPLLARDRPLGALVIYRDRPGPFAPEEIELLQSFASQAALAMDNARLLEDSERRRRAAESLADVGTLLSQSLDPAVVSDRIVQQLATLLRARAAAVYRVEAPSGDLVAVAGSGEVAPSFANLRLPAGTGLAGLTARTGEPVASPNILTDPRITWTEAGRSGIEQATFRAAFALPLLLEGRVLGVLAVADVEGRVFGEEETELARAFAQQAALALHNADLFAAIRAREQAFGEQQALLQTTLEHMSPGVSVFDGDLRLRAWNTRLFELLEFPRELARVGQPLEAFFRYNAARGEYGPGDPEQQVAERLALARQFAPHCFERSRPDGTVIEVRGMPMPGGGFVTTYTDVSERKHAERALAERARHAALRAATAAALSAGGPADATLQRAAEALVEHLDAAFARIWTLGADGAVLELRASAGLYTHRDGAHARVPVGQLKIGRIAASRAPLWTNAVADDPHIHDPAWARREGLVAFAGVPLVVEDRLVGVMALFSRQALSESAVEAMQSVAISVAQAVERAQSERERAQLEDQLRQAQKMEAIGRLAGGVAHDFNNLLSVITGRTGLLLHRLDAADPLRRHVDLIEKTAERAAGLTGQLLAFSRKQILQPAILDPNVVVAGMEKMLRRLIAENITIVPALDAGVGRVRADRGQLEQVLLNLTINARDAMPEGGRVIIETTNVELDDSYARIHAGVTPGPYVLLAVTDTGVGMTAETREHLFEPFFSTKGPEKGTGLGLATVYGIVKQSGGHIAVYSEPGLGSTFRIYLPRVDGGLAPSPVPAAVRPPGGSETILLVEDEEAVRDAAREILQLLGYTVLEARHPGEALLIAEQREEIHLLLTDVVMPAMSGPELAGRLAARHPSMRVLYMSGYPSQAVELLGEGTAFLPKPFTLDGLARKVRQVLTAGMVGL
jgi:GAF domain-containing protein/CheY-like chemotaxis protein